MARFETVDDYIASFPGEMQEMLQTVRKAIRDAVPEAEEVIWYNIPATKYHGWLLHYDGFKSHISVAPPQPTGMWEAFSEELSSHELTKNTIKFPLNKSVPVELIAAYS